MMININLCQNEKLISMTLFRVGAHACSRRVLRLTSIHNMAMGGQMEAGWKEGIVTMLECISWSHVMLTYFRPPLTKEVWWSRGLNTIFKREKPHDKDLKEEFFLSVVHENLVYYKLRFYVLLLAILCAFIVRYAIKSASVTFQNVTNLMLIANPYSSKI